MAVMNAVGIDQNKELTKKKGIIYSLNPNRPGIEVEISLARTLRS